MTLGSLLHRQLAAESHICCVIDLCSPLYVILCLCRETGAERSGVSDCEVEGVGASSRAERDDEDPISRLGDVERRSESDHRRARVRISNHRDEKPRFDLFHRKSESRRDALRELRVGLVEDRPFVVLCGGA